MNRKFRCMIGARREVYDLRRGLALPVIGSAFPYFRHKFKGYRQALRIIESCLGNRLAGLEVATHAGNRWF